MTSFRYPTSSPKSVTPRREVSRPGSRDVEKRLKGGSASAYDDSSKHITNYSTSGEILTAAQTIFPVPEAQGKMVKVPAVGDYGTVELHAVQHSIEGLRARELRLLEQVTGR